MTRLIDDRMHDGSRNYFRYKGRRFSINDQYGDFWFFVQDPSCPEALLARVAAHFSAFPGEPATPLAVLSPCADTATSRPPQ